VLLLPPFDRERRDTAHALRALALAARERPRVVITSGAGNAVAFCAAARALGARLLFVETMARVGELSASGRVLARLAHRTLVQWRETAAVVGDAVVCRPALLEDISATGGCPGDGTFVAFGTHHQPFPRLMSLVATAVAKGVLPRPVVVQAGATQCPPALRHEVEAHRWLSPDAMRTMLVESGVVVSHAGAGIAAAALRAGRRPILLARRGNLGEHVDDHQIQIARALESRGLAVVVDDAITAADVTRARTPIAPPRWDDGPRVSDEIASFVTSAER
jgi:UDP-N-acetylglucosamine--N-acetylmuramyl-(pentapeptide) pyrophosphoryl-undecaprenol N-acetylglucosamine transferase